MTRKLKESYNKTNWIMKSVWHEMVNIHVIQQLADTLLLLDSKQGSSLFKQFLSSFCYRFTKIKRNYSG